MAKNTSEIRAFLLKVFTPVEFEGFCFDYFSEVQEKKFASSQTEDERVGFLLQYCRRQNKWTELQAALQEAQPILFAEQFPDGIIPVSTFSRATERLRRKRKQILIGLAAIGVVLVAVLLLPAIQSGMPLSTLVPTTSVASLPATVFPSATAGAVVVRPTLFSTPTPTPTLTPTVTPTSTLATTPVASLALPVRIGTPVPLPTEVISATNAQRIQQLAQWGNGSPTRIMYSPDGKYLAVLASRGIYLYDAQTRQELRFIARPSMYYSVAFVPQADRLLVSQNESFYLYPLSGNDPPEKVPADYWITSVAASPDGKWLAAGQDGGDYGVKLQIWDWKKSFVPVFTQIYTPSVLSLAFSPDSQTLAAGLKDGNISLINRQGQWGEQRVLSGHTEGVWSLAFSPKGTWLASGGDDGTLKVWNWQPLTGTIVYSETHKGNVYRVAFGPGNTEDWLTLALADGENKVRVVPVTGEASSPPFEQLTYPAGVIDVAYAPGGDTLGVVTYDALVELIHAQNGRRFDSLSGFTPGYVGDLFFTSGDQVLWSGMMNDAGIRQWPLPVGQPTLVLTGNLGNGRFAVSPDKRYAAAPMWNHYVRVWNISSPSKYTDWNLAPDHDPWRVAFSSQQLMAAGDVHGTVWVWKMLNHALLFTLTHASAITVTAIEFSPDGNLLAVGGEDGTARVWRVADHSLAFELPRYSKAVNDMTFSPDGTLLAVSMADGNIKIKRIGDDKEPLELANEGVQEDVQAVSLAFAPSGDLLAVNLSNGNTQVWSVPKGELLITLDGHNAYVEGLAFSNDGRLLATGAHDATIALWGIPSH